MNTYRPMDCDLHDYLEIACLHRYRLSIELVDGGVVVAQAITTRTADTKEEFLRLRGDDGDIELRLDRLLAITPLDAGSAFGRVLLQPPSGSV